MKPAFGDTRPLFGYPDTGKREGSGPPLPPVVGVQLGMDGTELRAPNKCRSCAHRRTQHDRYGICRVPDCRCWWWLPWEDCE